MVRYCRETNKISVIKIVDFDDQRTSHDSSPFLPFVIGKGFFEVLKPVYSNGFAAEVQERLACQAHSAHGAYGPKTLQGHASQ